MNCMDAEATLDAMESVQEFVIRDVESLSRSDELIQDIKLVVEEIFTNIVFYAYPEGGGSVRITCFRGSQGIFCIGFQDTGVPFDPLEFQVADLERDFSEREIGGLGIHLVKRLAHEVRYEREGLSNILTVCFRVT